MIWQPTPRQAEALARTEREILFGGSRGGGKTEAGRVWLIDPAVVNRKSYRALVIRANYKDLSDWIGKARILYHGMAEVFPAIGEIRLKSGGTIYMGHWGDPSALSNYLGREFHRIVIEELTDVFANEIDYLRLLGSLRSSDPEIIPQIFCTTNPGGKGHSWVKKRFVDVAYNKPYIEQATGHSRIMIPARLVDNPYLMDADPAYVQFLDHLPERLRKAWRDGDWNLAEGAFFTDFGTHMAESPYEVPESDCFSRLFGSLDVGTTHHTSFGLWHMDRSGVAHRLFTYCKQLNSTKEHALAIREAIEGFRWSKGYMPQTVWASVDAWTKVRLNENMFRAPIDEYVDAFANCKRPPVFQKALNNRVNGCMAMQQAFKGVDGMPSVRYFQPYNEQFSEAIPACMIDPGNPETYEKTDAPSDDIADECRYGIAGLATWISQESQGKYLREQATKLHEQVLREDWYNL